MKENKAESVMCPEGPIFKIETFEVGFSQLKMSWKGGYFGKLRKYSDVA